ncbi:MAG: nucleoside hydrolase [Clostridia bacterium]|nr:nucleoside hydrolase [Clostridia bacterium]
MTKKAKIIIDMDIGDDIDDAIALYAAMRREFDIIGVTTVFQNTVERARQAKKLLIEYGNGYENVPVFAGHGGTIHEKKEYRDHIPHYTPELDNEIYAPDGTDPDDAVNFIIESCHKYGKELTVIAIGAFTNIAKVIEKDGGALDSISRVVIMGGAYYKQYADWNVICDVEAADVMFRNLHNLECIGADVTHLMISEQALYDNLLHYSGNEKGHIYLTELCHLWEADRSKSDLLLHDPLVIYYVADSGICKMNSASVAVITDGYGRGMTLNVDAYGKKAYNPAAYVGFDEKHRTLVAETADRDTFNSRILDDFNV